MRRTVISTIIVLAVLLVISYPGHSIGNAGSGGPSIGTPITTPSAPGSSDQVTVNVTVTSSAGVQSVMIVYTTDNWASNQTVQAPYVPRFDDYQGVIPAQPDGTHVSYYVVAVDVSSNQSVNNNSGSYYSYTVSGTGGGGGGGGGSFNITSTSMWLIAAILGAIMVGMVVVFKRRSSSAKPARK